MCVCAHDGIAHRLPFITFFIHTDELKLLLLLLLLGFVIIIADNFASDQIAVAAVNDKTCKLSVYTLFFFSPFFAQRLPQLFFASNCFEGGRTNARRDRE